MKSNLSAHQVFHGSHSYGNALSFGLCELHLCSFFKAWVKWRDSVKTVSPHTSRNFVYEVAILESFTMGRWKVFLFSIPVRLIVIGWGKSITIVKIALSRKLLVQAGISSQPCNTVIKLNYGGPCLIGREALSYSSLPVKWTKNRNWVNCPIYRKHVLAFSWNKALTGEK